MSIISTLLLFALVGVPVANPYDGRISMFENGKEVTKTYHQILKEKSEKGLSALSLEVHKRALAVFDDPRSNELKKRYLTSFPTSFRLFIQTFHPKEFGQLYDGFIYISLLNELANEYPDLVVVIYLKLASDACLDADAPNYLRHNLITFEQNHARLYKRYYVTLTEKQKINIEKFKRASLHDGGEGVCNF